MLQAKTKEGNLVMLALLTKKEISELKTNGQFYCPSCQEKVVIKAGSKMIPHFAHRAKVNCPSHEGGEGAYHEKGKLMLYKWLKQQKLNVQLEEYLSEIKQRPDLLVTIDNKKIAVEYQCTRISLKEIRKRNEGYRQLGIQPIWIIGANRFKRLSRYQIKLDNFLHHFLHQFSKRFPLTLLFFCPETTLFSTFQDIYITTTKQAIGKLTYTLLNNMKFIDIFRQHRLPNQLLYTLWKQEKKRFRLRQRDRLYGSELAWHQWLYLKRTHFEYLPSVIHLPVSAQYRMCSPLWDWQSRICLDLLDPLPIGGHISLSTCVHLLRKHIISSANYPLITAEIQPIQQYLLLLEQLNILKQQSPFHFTKQTNLLFYKNVEEALLGDDVFINRLLANNSIKI
ncbi:competence protein CoiA [Virgibacillus dakarensis]|uniref:competence protein CoiA n=1 Tax=Virgibacillus dakarensis TaxID=1917889 RepID=UPI000B448FCB|nr:competence protein CoiA family protein [Virgibacillus dakarensis]MBT2215439.1 competence protein CoiA [Virgibacillus dakarensis]